MTLGRPALVAWMVTTALGVVLLSKWLRRGGISQVPRGARLAVGVPPSYFPPPLVFGHLLLADVGLVVWIAYLLTNRGLLAWVAFAILGAVVLLGVSMFGRWVGSRRMRVTPPAAPAPDPESRLPVLFKPGLAESRLPLLVVVAHGLVASSTVLLVFLTAIGYRL